MSPLAVVELFHLVFTRAFFADLGDKRVVAVKGGINLRLFLGSVRYSEDLDLDVVAMSKGVLEKRVDRLLKGPAVVTVLKARDINIANISKPKQTDTVQRWKVALAVDDAAVEYTTKIEFSRRPGAEQAALDAVAAEVANAYSIQTFVATHYRCPEAVRQKVRALAGRAETQPRDVFDLHVLLSRVDAPNELDDEAKTWIDEAVANAMALTYAQYEALVVAFLDPEHAAVYGSRESWDSMQLEVITRLEAFR